MRALLHALRLLFPLLIVAAVVGGIVSVVRARPDLQNAKHSVDVQWADLTPHLDGRYTLLATADAQLSHTSGPVHQLVANVDAALSQWHRVVGKGSVSEQVSAANSVEAMGRRLLATAIASPRVKADPAAKDALLAYLGDQTLGTATTFNATVANYERERRGPVRRIVASLLGDHDIPAFDTTPVS